MAEVKTTASHPRSHCNSSLPESISQILYSNELARGAPSFFAKCRNRELAHARIVHVLSI
jgi:hypothetical protein